MTPVVPCSITSVLLFPGAALAVGKVYCSTGCSLFRKSLKPASLSLFSQYRRKCALHHKLHLVSATETGVETSEEPTNESAATTLSRNARKSEMAAVKNEDLILGATFTGKVRSVQPFGAFVDIGAFTDGLVHVSRLSDSFVEDVGSVVSIGQEVKVRVVEVNLETKRLGLSMREGDEARNGPPSPRSNQKNPSKFEIGEKLVGTVKNITRAGAFITLPDEEEGFLPRSEEKSEGFHDFDTTTALAVGQEVNVLVLRKNKGQTTLTMKEESITGEKPNTATELYSDGVVHVATNPFLVAFRSDKDIAMFLDKREKPRKTQGLEMPDQNETGSYITEAQDRPAI